MQETRSYDSKIIRQFVQESTPELLRERMQQLHAKAIADPEIKSVYQMKIGRNEPCPCGSGRKFKKCCISEVNR